MEKIIGTLLPMSALGTFEKGEKFLDWLQKTNQSAWQLLPLYETQLEKESATKHVPSPYKSYGIGLDPKYLPKSFINIFPTESQKNDFISTNLEWINDYAFFCAIRDYFKTDDWTKWDEGLKNREKDTLMKWKEKLKKEIDYHIILQWKLHEAYKKLKTKAKSLGISMYGDLPFYVSISSPLVWANIKLFQIEKDGSMNYVSGSANPSSAHFGRQVWGHPLYKWGLNNKSIFKLWEIRIRYLSKLFDVIRFDHASGIFEYGAKDPANTENDVVKKGPGVKFFEQLIKLSAKYNFLIYAEDSGVKLHDLRDCLKRLKISGIKIFRFALIEQKNLLIQQYASINSYPENSVVYTSTHDTETLLGYLNLLNPEQKRALASSAGVSYDLDDKILAKRIREAVLSSPARVVIIPIQDWLLTKDRINTPGTEKEINDPNWNFTLKTPIEKLPTKF